LRIKMPEYDGKVHIFTGLYWGFLVSHLGGYSTFLAGTAWFLIVTYYTQPTYQTIINTIASTFYDRVIASSLEKIIDELASSGVTDFITGAVLFVITALKSILGGPKPREGSAKSKASIFRSSNTASRGSHPVYGESLRDEPPASIDTTMVSTILLRVGASPEGTSPLPVPQKLEAPTDEVVESLVQDLSISRTLEVPITPRGTNPLGLSTEKDGSRSPTSRGSQFLRDEPPLAKREEGSDHTRQGLKEVDVSTPPLPPKLATSIDVPVLRPPVPPVPPKIKIGNLR
jgi:hypothetical protein